MATTDSPNRVLAPSPNPVLKEYKVTLTSHLEHNPSSCLACADELRARLDYLIRTGGIR